MAESSILCLVSSLIPSLFTLFSWFFGHCNSVEQLGGYDTFTISSFKYPETQIRPFDMRYVRVDLPPWFSSVLISLKSSVDLDIESIERVPKSMLPMICFRDGSLPLPDVSNTSFKALVALSNGSFEGIKVLQNTEQCYPVPKNMTIKLTNEQIAAGVLYFGLFNGVGPTRTQSKMIVRGPAYSFAANISVEGCTTSTMQGQYCNQTVDLLSCGRSGSYNSSGNLSVLGFHNQSMVSCRNNFETSCHGAGEMKIYSLEILRIAELLTISVKNVRLRPLNSTGNSSRIDVMCFARYGAMPSATLHDYSGNLNKSPLVIHSPKAGRLYITILPLNLSKEIGVAQGNASTVCYSLELQALECPLGKAGPTCSAERYMLQTVLRKDSTPFESYYLPDVEKVMSDAANFLLEPLLSNYTYGEGVIDTWTYFLLDVPRGAAGGNLHVRLTSDRKINYEIYARNGGLPALDNWDYYYVNKTSSSHGSMFFVLYHSSEQKIDFYILYVREGIWNIALRHLYNPGGTSDGQTTMSISLERCPKRCSYHGDCRSALDASGLTSYSFCACDRNHGGFDCSIQIVSHQGHIWQSIALIASNGAAVLPAFWALRQKAFAEWVLFTASGISSGLYHACDVGTWCALSFGVLQFMDFWLSFMAVVSTFVYLTTIDEVFKRTIHTVVAILTALMAITKATRSSNIILVMGIGALGLFVGWLIEFSTNYRSLSFSMGLCLNRLERWQIRDWLSNLVKTVLKRFRWGFVLAGFTALAMAAISWKLETSQNYWIWHSVWHVTIYSSSFFFLCSKVTTINSGNEGPSNGNYQLTQQDSISRGA
ncbi:Transmembrane protein-related, putative [Theobroma cacao]|uniref:Transmembrane protein-related, putative n=1 Tax=Theobroma cacao TaxID=3641 RepID=A0A061DSY0_THECC|nr:Transmembrane protein-related, putative [Theobroma cacao]